jgi:ribosomal protein L35AE/L33A
MKQRAASLSLRGAHHHMQGERGAKGTFPFRVRSFEHSSAKSKAVLGPAMFYKEELLGCGLWHKSEIVAMGSVCKGKITVRHSQSRNFRARKNIELEGSAAGQRPHPVLGFKVLLRFEKI